MTIGLIVECGPEGAETEVLPILIGKLGHKERVSMTTLDNKRKLTAGCGLAAANLIAQGCRKVLIVWDLYPAWREGNEHPCRHEDKKDILASLAAAKVAQKKVSLICVEEELEAWLIADGRALMDLLSTPEHPLRGIKNQKSPDDIRNPKKMLNRLFKQATGKDYSDIQHAKKIANVLPDLKKLRRSPSFCRFAAKLI